MPGVTLNLGLQALNNSSVKSKHVRSIFSTDLLFEYFKILEEKDSVLECITFLNSIEDIKLLINNMLDVIHANHFILAFKQLKLVVKYADDLNR